MIKVTGFQQQIAFILEPKLAWLSHDDLEQFYCHLGKTNPSDIVTI